MDQRTVGAETVIVKIETNHCNGCMNNIKKSLQKIGGIHRICIDAEEGKITISGTIDPPTLAKILRKIKKKSEFLLKPMDEPYCSNNQATYAQHSHCCRPRNCACTTTKESFAMGYPEWPGINIPSAPPPAHEYYQTTPPEMAYNHPIYQTFSDYIFALVFSGSVSFLDLFVSLLEL
ncbi:hypothetical protein POM88_048742 [Heracleum sosnowskyi]|uniref:HMA domain-containing protein n=1 Tax=Heracleum sosnowskyi TaxID=360622 RepID=A0AAD8LZX0_9APIA|nr:hypothetical protein POM88_048742 [Heracleum sosnowskyi]